MVADRFVTKLTVKIENYVFHIYLDTAIFYRKYETLNYLNLYFEAKLLEMK